MRCDRSFLKWWYTLDFLEGCSTWRVKPRFLPFWEGAKAGAGGACETMLAVGVQGKVGFEFAKDLEVEAGVIFERGGSTHHSTFHPQSGPAISRA